MSRFELPVRQREVILGGGFVLALWIGMSANVTTFYRGIFLVGISVALMTVMTPDDT